jgi:hypothetical protein
MQDEVIAKELLAPSKARWLTEYLAAPSQPDRQGLFTGYSTQR